MAIHKILTILSKGEMEVFKKDFLEFCNAVEEESLKWRLNHIVRTITGVCIASIWIYYLFYDLHHNEVSLSDMLVSLRIARIALYYGTVWATFISAGYVNDMILYMIMRVLSRMECDTDVEKQTKRDLILEVPNLFQNCDMY